MCRVKEAFVYMYLKEKRLNNIFAHSKSQQEKQLKVNLPETESNGLKLFSVCLVKPGNLM